MSELIKLSGDVSELQDDMSGVKEKLVEHDMRFDNGRHAMVDIRSRIATVENEIKPKAPDWLKLMLAGLSVVGILMGAQLWMTDRFNDRPTHSDVEKMAAPIQEAQKETANDVGRIRESQAAQQTSIKTIETTQVQQNSKIDMILERLPARRGQ